MRKWLASVALVAACGGDADRGANDPDASAGRDLPSYAGHVEGSGQLEVAAGGRVITPHGYEVFRDCGPDGSCPGDDGYTAPDDGEGNGEYDMGETFLDCGLDRLCPGDAGYAGPDEGEDDGDFQALFLAGFGGSYGARYGGRPMQGVHDDIWIRALYLRQGDAEVVLLVFDVVGLMPKYVNAIKRRLRDDLGVSPVGVVVAATHNHEAPDSMGLWSTDGAEPRFMLPSVDAAVELVARLRGAAEPADVRAAEGDPDGCLDAAGQPARFSSCSDRPYWDAAGDEPLLATDTRDPYVRDLAVPAVRFEGGGGGVIATLVGFSNHVETLADENSLASADYAGYVRERIAATGGGEAVFVAGAVGGLMTPLRDTAVPGRGPDGERILDEGGNVILLREPSFDKARSLGYEVADAATQALDSAAVNRSPRLVADTINLDLPIDPMLRVLLELTEYLDDEDKRVFDDEARCGVGGCLRTELTLITLGEVSLITAPGEMLPDMWLGRDAVSVPYPDLPDYPFAELAGIRPAMPGSARFVVGLANVELGYLVPPSDFLDEQNPYLGGLSPENHPNYYEESVSPAPSAALLYCDLARALLGAATDCLGVPRR